MQRDLLRRKAAVLAFILAAAWAAPALRGQDAVAKSRYEFRENHDPNGIGKFYMGREIAMVMGHEAADWLERPEREWEEAPAKLMKALKLRPDMTVADIGAGSGYYTFRIAKAVGPRGRVLAVDIQQEMLDFIAARARREGFKNVVPILGEVANPKLKPNSVDLILLVDVYHELEHPWEMTREMVRAMKPGGRLVLVEFRMEDPDVPIKQVHKMSEAQVKKEMAVHPELRWAETYRGLPWQHAIFFEKRRPASAMPTDR